jgi:hypothetical protein
VALSVTGGGPVPRQARSLREKEGALSGLGSATVAGWPTPVRGFDAGTGPPRASSGGYLDAVAALLVPSAVSVCIPLGQVVHHADADHLALLRIAAVPVKAQRDILATWFVVATPHGQSSAVAELHSPAQDLTDGHDRTRALLHWPLAILSFSSLMTVRQSPAFFASLTSSPGRSGGPLALLP